jgi:hypothetical protein
MENSESIRLSRLAGRSKAAVSSGGAVFTVLFLFLFCETPVSAQYQRADEVIFIGALASASAPPQRSEDSQADGRPRPATEGSRA